MLPPFKNLYGPMAQRREEELERQRLAEARLPKGNFTDAYVTMVNAWVWLPGQVLDAPLAVNDKLRRHSIFDVDLRLLDAEWLPQPVRRLETQTGKQPAIEAAYRTTEILKAVFDQWNDAFYESVDWDATQVVLFPPTAIADVTWLVGVDRLWPREHLPRHGFALQTQPPAQWLPQMLSNSAGPEYLLCLSLDTWACTEQLAAFTKAQMGGEAVSAVLLRRQSKTQVPTTDVGLKLFTPINLSHAPRSTQKRKDTQILENLMAELSEQTGIAPEKINVVISEGLLEDRRIEQLFHYTHTHLPELEMEDQQIRLSIINGRVGAATEQWVQLGLAWLTVSADPGSAAWILDRQSAENTQSWLIG